MKSIYALNRTLNILFNKDYKDEDDNNKTNIIHELYKRI